MWLLCGVVCYVCLDTVATVNTHGNCAAAVKRSGSKNSTIERPLASNSLSGRNNEFALFRLVARTAHAHAELPPAALGTVLFSMSGHNMNTCAARQPVAHLILNCGCLLCASSVSCEPWDNWLWMQKSRVSSTIVAHDVVHVQCGQASAKMALWTCLGFIVPALLPLAVSGGGVVHGGVGRSVGRSAGRLDGWLVVVVVGCGGWLL